MAACFNYGFALELLGRRNEAGEYCARTSEIFRKDRYQPILSYVEG